MSTAAWIGHGPWEDTPRFYDARPCPDCRCKDRAVPHKSAPVAIRAICSACLRVGAFRTTWREALADFYGPLPGRSPQRGPKVGARLVVCESNPAGIYPLGGLTAGDVVTLVDFEMGAFTVQRECDAFESVIARQNIGQVLPA